MSQATIGTLVFTVEELEQMIATAKAGGLVEIQLIPKVVVR